MEPYVSPPVLTEVARVLREKVGVSETAVTTALRVIARAAGVVRPRRRVGALEDE